MVGYSSIKASASVADAWSRFRQSMPVAKKWSYFDHAAVAPLPEPVLKQIQKWATEAAHEGDTEWPNWNRQHENCRSLAAQIINAELTEIALVPNTTFGINLVADGLNWKPGDNVVLPENEFPSNLYPWMALESRGVELRQVPLDGNRVCPDRIANACDDRTRIVSVSWVGYASGYRIDPKEISAVVHDQGALFFLDAIQGMGVFPLDVKEADIDFLAADGHKWMLGPEGAGIFYSKFEHLELLRPMNIGWKSVSQGSDFMNVGFNIRDAASRYEGGTQNFAGFIGLAASLEMLMKYGLTSNVSPIADRVVEVSDLICQRLEEVGAVVHSDRGAAVSSGIVLFQVPNHEPTHVRAKLLENNVVTSCRGGHLRVAAHCYNDDYDVERLVDTIKKLD